MTIDVSERRPRMADVAEAAGVSRATASFVLNGRAAAIPPDTRQRVLDAADRLGYRANRIAQLLARQRTCLIGTAIPVVENPFFATLTAYLNHRVNQLGYRLIFEVTEDGGDEMARRNAVEQLLDWRVDGLLLYNSEVYPQPVSDLVAMARTPVVFIGTAPPDPTCGDVDSVYLDNYAGARAAAEHLIALGHRRLGHISPRNASGGTRERATKDACCAAGLPPPVVQVCPTESAADAQAAALALAGARMAGGRVTAAVCHNDLIALGALRGFRDAGLRVPQDVSVIGYDDNWAAAYGEPPLSTVEFPYRRMVDHALELLVRRMTGDAPGSTGSPDAPESSQRVALEPRVVARESTARAEEQSVEGQARSRDGGDAVDIIADVDVGPRS